MDKQSYVNHLKYKLNENKYDIINSVLHCLFTFFLICIVVAFLIVFRYTEEVTTFYYAFIIIATMILSCLFMFEYMVVSRFMAERKRIQTEIHIIEMKGEQNDTME